MKNSQRVVLDTNILVSALLFERSVPGLCLISVLERPAPAVSRAVLEVPPRDDEIDPVFLVGFPRSGTTLLEQLLDAHPSLASFDEQPFMQRVLLRSGEGGVAYPDSLAVLDPERRDRLRAGYFRDVDQVLRGRGECRAVDKNPLNLSRLPLIDALFPRAHVLLAIRHPCDVVLSCYMQSFRAPAFAVTFETIDSTARMYDQVMQHYLRSSECVRAPVHVIRYEDLVADVRGEGIRMFEFLGLVWDDALLAFTERAAAKGAISTPSYSQVVQPVNARAIGRWEKYREHFGQASLDLLAPWVKHFGYTPID